MNYHWNWGIFWEISPDASHSYLQTLLLGTAWTLATALAAWVLALTFGSMLDVCGAKDVVWVSDSFLLEHGVEEWIGLPLWMPSTNESYRAMHLIDVSRAVAAGLAFRPLAESARDVPEWTGKAGLTSEREAELLEAWRAVA